MAEMYARLCDSTELPLFADADTGYGNTTNVARTMRAYERAGVAGLFIEDQVSPKRCGHMEGKRIVPAVEMAAKLKAALDARVDADLIICAHRAGGAGPWRGDRPRPALSRPTPICCSWAPVTVEEMHLLEIPAPASPATSGGA
jgi:methylisocitrate lyase